MPREVIVVPPLNKGPLDVVRVCKDILEAPDCEELVLDLKRIGWTPPFAMLMLSRSIRRLATERRNDEREAVQSPNSSVRGAHGYVS